ncbi:tRNA pseudouridine(13) synthase TruD [Salinisphaera sp. SWV1]|uniref:tRNA pseudouridine(13) synthase TruD n=1 Tax=Salinisphaera sp. SWV1 TaxID=3454139 RepID=UPI003F83B075
MDYLNGDAVDVAAFAHVESGPSASGRLRATPADFRVEEICDVELSGEGEHVWLWVEKTGLTTPQAVERLAAAIGVAARNIGYSGLKDRHAMTRQWLSLTWPIKQALPAWPADDDLRVLEARRHGRKLRCGTHRANRFDIVVRQVDGLDATAFAARVARVRRDGVPNYFGPQRFGHGGRNIELSQALFSGRRLSRGRRSFALSAARSLIFNAVLDARLRAGAWPGPLTGDVFMLAGSHSVFAAADTEESWDSLIARAARGDIEPTGPMPGRRRDGAVSPSDAAAEMENRVLAGFPDFCDGLAQFGVDAERRALRLPLTGLEATVEGDDMRLSFTLSAGAFATSVIRELVRAEDMAGRG